MAPMAVLTVFVLWLVLAAATEQRRGEVAVARLRGRGPAGAVGLLLIELLPVLLVGVVPGAAAALLGGALARSLLPGAAPFEAGPGFVDRGRSSRWSAVVLTTVAAAVRVAREPLDGLVRSGRVPSRRWALGALDAFLIAAVGTGVLAFVTGSLSGPFALAGPALLALLAGLLLAHLVAPAASASGRRLLRRGRLVARRDPARDGPAPGDPRGDRRDHRGQCARRLRLRRRRRRATATAPMRASTTPERRWCSASPGATWTGCARRWAPPTPPAAVRRPSWSPATTLAVEPDGFRRIAFFPRGAPTDAQWRAIAPPDKEPVDADGLALLPHRADRSGLTSIDALGQLTPSSILSLVVTTGTGTRRTIPPRRDSAARRARDARRERLGMCERLPAGRGGVQRPPRGSRSTATSTSATCGSTGARPTGRPRRRTGTRPRTQHTVIRPSSTASGDALRLLLSIHGIYPAELTPAWVPRTVPALLPAARRDPLGLEVTGVDGSDRPARVRRPGHPHPDHARSLGAGGPRRDLPRCRDHLRRPCGGLARRRPRPRRRRERLAARARDRRRRRTPRLDDPAGATRTRSPPGASPWVPWSDRP